MLYVGRTGACFANTRGPPGPGLKNCATKWRRLRQSALHVPTCTSLRASSVLPGRLKVTRAVCVCIIVRAGLYGPARRATVNSVLVYWNSCFHWPATRRMVCCCTQCKPTVVPLYGCMELVNDQISPKMCCHESCNGNRHLSPEDTRDRHYYRIGLCYKLFVPVAFGSETIGGFCPGSKG